MPHSIRTSQRQCITCHHCLPGRDRASLITIVCPAVQRQTSKSTIIWTNTRLAEELMAACIIHKREQALVISQGHVEQLLTEEASLAHLLA